MLYACALYKYQGTEGIKNTEHLKYSEELITLQLQLSLHYFYSEVNNQQHLKILRRAVKQFQPYFSAAVRIEDQGQIPDTPGNALITLSLHESALMSWTDAHTNECGAETRTQTCLR